MTVVDQLLFGWRALSASLALKDDVLERARRSGRHVAKRCGETAEEAELIVPPNVCPVCHSSVRALEKHQRNPS
jgi:hypothetical protein